MSERASFESEQSMSSRRHLLTAALGGLAGWVASAIGRAAPVRAADDDPVLIGHRNEGAHTTKLTVTQQSVAALWGVSPANSGEGVGVRGYSGAPLGKGVSGEAPGGMGVYGETSSGWAMRGAATGAGFGVYGTSISGVGGVFSGGRAQLRLVAKTTLGRPTTGIHVRGAYGWTPAERCSSVPSAALPARGAR